MTSTTPDNESTPRIFRLWNGIETGSEWTSAGLADTFEGQGQRAAANIAEENAGGDDSEVHSEHSTASGSTETSGSAEVDSDHSSPPVPILSPRRAPAVLRAGAPDGQARRRSEQASSVSSGQGEHHPSCGELPPSSGRGFLSVVRRFIFCEKRAKTD